MSSGSVPAGRTMRHTTKALVVPLTMQTVRAAYPLIRALVLATIVTLLIMVGLPQLLAAAAAAS
jgi:hypothetical protein